ncbi:MAG: choice-of-anchor D domain-containing protein [Thioploca sp.]|nr:choice-of-anchor D domain-containing protein [Thioploca sp.]
MLAETKDNGGLSRLFLACPFQQWHFNFPSRPKKSNILIYSFISKSLPELKLSPSDFLRNLMTSGRFLFFLLSFCVWTSFVQAEGIISTVAGTGSAGYDGEGVAINQMLNSPAGVAVDSIGNLYIADWQNHRIRKVDSAGNITTVAGTGAAGYNGEGLATDKMLNLPRDVAVDSAGNLYIADAGNHRIRKVDSAGNMTTVAGIGIEGDDGDGMATVKMLANPLGITVDSAGNLYIADTNNNRILKVDSIIGNMTIVIPSAISSVLPRLPRDVALGSASDLYIADSGNHRILKVDSTGNETIVAGTGTAGYDGEGVATSKMLNDPGSIAVDSNGNLYIADRQNQRIRKVDSAGNMTTVAGTGIAGYDGEGMATSKMLNEPNGIAVDSVGNLSIAERKNHRIRKIVFNDAPVANDVNISFNSLKIGEILQGNYTYSDTEKDLEDISTFQWYTATDATCTTEKTAIPGAISQTYTLTSNEVDKYLCFEVTPVAASGINPGTAVLVTSSSTVSKIDQTITFTALAAKTDGDAPFTVSATASSELPVNFSGTGNCIVTDTTVTLTGAGSCTIIASQAGDATYSAATDVVQTFMIAAKKVTLTVSKSGTGNGTLSSLPAGIHCGVNCQASFNAATLVMLTAQAATGSKFVGFSGNEDCSDGNLTLNADKTCNAIFELLPTTPVVNNLVFSLKVIGNGRVTSTPVGINCSRTCKATFASGTRINLTAKPDNGFKFAGFSGSACTEGHLTLNMPTQCEVAFVPVLPGTAQFSASHYEVTAEKATVGVIVKRAGGTDGTLTVNYATQDDTAKADQDYVVAKGSLTWADGESDDKSIIITLLDNPMITDAEKVFAIQLTDASGKILDTAKVSLLEKHKIPATLTVTLVGQGQVSSDPVGISCSEQCQHGFDMGTNVTLTAIPESGWQLAKWQGDCDANGSVIMDKEKQCEAILVKTVSLPLSSPLATLFPLTITLVGQGKVISTPTGINCGNQCQALFEPNTAITLTIIPESGWQLAKWQGDCDANGLMIMDKEKQCEATFVTINPDTNVTINPDTNGVPLIPPSDTNPSLVPASYSNIPNEVVPQLVVNPGFHHFGNLPVGDLSSAQVITVTNAGNADWQLGQLTISSNEFILAETCSNQTLSAGNHCAATISFQPQLAGVKTAYLAIPLDNPNQTTVTVVTLTGKGKVIRKRSRLTRDIKYLIGNDTTDLPLSFTSMSLPAAAVTSIGEVSAVTDCTKIPQIECEALIALYKSTDGPNWKLNTRWNKNNAPCGNANSPWYGIECSRNVYHDNYYHITSIFLSGNQLNGTIPSEIGDLRYLEGLQLSDNQLSGPIPKELGKLSHLQYLDLFSNHLRDSIPPELGNLNNLQGLALFNNQLSGSIPPEFGNLSYLEELWLDGNKLSGTIPKELGDLSNLRNLGLWDNQLSGTIPKELGNLGNLEVLGLWKNQLSGQIPTELGNLSHLAYLYLDDNLLIGFIPLELSNLNHLEDLWLSENQLCDNLEPALKEFFDSHHVIWQPQNLTPANCALPPPAGDPLLATLTYFEATPVSTGILLKWQTLIETNNAGFIIWRGQPNGSQCTHHPADYHEIVPVDFEVSQGNSSSGATYLHQDNTVKPKTTYCYLLEDIDFEANGTFHWDSIASVISR